MMPFGGRSRGYPVGEPARTESRLGREPRKAFMSTGVIIALIVIVAAILVVAAVLALRARRGPAGQNLKRRFGPEYDRAVSRHDGDPKAAERELAERVERHGALRERPLEPAEREQYE